MLLVGLTGGIATGKSTVTAWFRTKNVAVIDCDQLVHDLQKPGTRCTRALDGADRARLHGARAARSEGRDAEPGRVQGQHFISGVGCGR